MKKVLGKALGAAALALAFASPALAADEAPAGKWQVKVLATSVLADGKITAVRKDLIGLPAHSTDGTVLGTCVGVDNYGAGDVLDIERPDGKRFMVPMRAEAVPEWNHDRLLIDALYAE